MTQWNITLHLKNPTETIIWKITSDTPDNATQRANTFIRNISHTTWGQRITDTSEPREALEEWPKPPTSQPKNSQKNSPAEAKTPTANAPDGKPS